MKKTRQTTQSTAHANALKKIARLEEYMRGNPKDPITAQRLAELKRLHMNKTALKK